jgi:hypothetical protein
MPEPAHLVGADEARHLGEPARRIPLEAFHHALAPWQSAESPDRVEHRQIRLALAEVLDALSARDQRGVRAGQAGQEGF